MRKQHKNTGNVISRLPGLLGMLICHGLVAPAAFAQEAASVPVRVTVDWSKAEGTVTRAHFGLNLFAGFAPENAIPNGAYKANLDYMNPGQVRFHHGGAMQPASKDWAGLLDDTGKTWDRAKIVRSLTALKRDSKSGKRASEGNLPTVMLNVPRWPQSMDANNDGFLDKEQYTAYAALLADLVRLVNVENKLGVRYWEILNEWDDRYFTTFYEQGGWGKLKNPNQPDQWDEVATVYNLCATAMKRIDPKIQVGGPAAARPDLTQMHERFARATLPNLDFFSFHAYAAGSAETPDEEIYDKAVGIGNYVARTVALVNRLSPNRRIPVMLTEYNISWTWETRDPRMTNHKGVVFDALVMVNAIRAGAESTLAWNERDGIYGKTDGNNQRRPGAELFHQLNTHLTGTRVAVMSEQEKRVTAFAVVGKERKERALLLINRTDFPCPVAVEFLGKQTKGKVARLYRISEKNSREEENIPLPEKSTRWTLPAHSVTFITVAE